MFWFLVHSDLEVKKSPALFSWCTCNAVDPRDYRDL